MKKNVGNVVSPKKIPPDGGYGWVVAFAFAIANFIYVPLMHSFGLIFKDTFAELHLTATQGSLILTLHASFGMILGLLNGVLLKMFGYRKVAFLAAVLYCSGLMLTFFARSFEHFLICYGLIASLGNGLNRSSYNLAVNTYFKKRRSRAMGFALTITSFGFVIMPLFVTFLMEYYTPQGVVLILAGISMHFFVTALLLQPVKRYMINDPEAVEEKSKAIEETEPSKDKFVNSQAQKSEKKKSVFSSISKFFDLDLLKDPIFINILVGMAFIIFAELNFNVLVPFIMRDYKLTTEQTATFMSVSAVADIVFRCLAPYIGDCLKKSPREIFVLTVSLTVIMRIGILVSSTFSILLLVACGLGMAKGVRRIYNGLIVPSHVSLEKLPSASGMEMMANGFCILGGGFILGMVRDLTGSYAGCIILMNCACLVTIIMWIAEAVCVKYNKKKTAYSTTKEPEENIPLNKL